MIDTPIARIAAAAVCVLVIKGIIDRRLPLKLACAPGSTG